MFLYPTLGYPKLGFIINKMSKIYTERYRSLLNKLIIAREKLGLTQSEVAKKLNKPQSYLSKIESGERKIDFIELEDLGVIYKTPIKKFQSK